MLQEITIQNFQAHKKLSIEFSPTITTIVGSSDTGKTAIIRALYWLAFNRPGGIAFVRDGAKGTEVKLRAEGKEIIRGKGKENLYSLGDMNFVAFGNDVPEEISKLLNLSPTINFQNQHDSPFWLSNTSGEVSRQLNQIVNLGIIDSTLGNLAGYLRAERAKVEVSLQRVTTAKAERKKLSHVKVMDEELKKVENLQTTFTKNRQNCSTIQAICTLVIEQQKVVDIASQAYSVGGVAVKTGETWAEVQNREKTLQNLVDNIVSFKDIVEQEIPDISPLEKLKTKLVGIQQRINDLGQLIYQVQFVKEREWKKRKEAKTEEERFRKLLGKECPLCEQKIK